MYHFLHIDILEVDLFEMEFFCIFSRNSWFSFETDIQIVFYFDYLKSIINKFWIETIFGNRILNWILIGILIFFVGICSNFENEWYIRLLVYY